MISQVVIFVSTAISYLAGMDTFFNHPTALNAKEAVPFGEAMGGRVITFAANVVTNAVIGAIGYGIAGLTGPKK